MISITDIFKLIPDSLKQTAVDAIVETVVERGEGLLSESILGKIKGLRSDAAFRKQFDSGLKRGLQRFVDEYQLQDEDLVAAIIADETLFTRPGVQQALLTILQQPGHYLAEEQTALSQSFAAVMPQRLNRERVDRAVAFLLKCLARELWHLPELQPIYSLEFQRITAESSREQLAVQKAQLAAIETLNVGVRDALLQLTNALDEQKQLAAGQSSTALSASRPAVYHNLPQPEYGEFIGREAEIKQIFELLRPYPQSRHHLIVIDGIGGIGKSTLALEVAHRCLHASLQAAGTEQPEQDHLVRLREMLVDRFSEEELRTLCFDMALDYDMLPGQGKGGKARELIAYLERRQRIDELIETVQRLRPDIRDHNWQPMATAQEVVAEQFDAIIWISAKNNVLKAEGIAPRRQIMRTLDDIFAAIASTLSREDITRASAPHRDSIVRQALREHRTLLCIDNLETVDDVAVQAFLRELPAPTKALVTTRHRIDVAYTLRLRAMEWSEAVDLINQEKARRQVEIEETEVKKLFDRTGGIPLAITWSIAQMAFGYPVGVILKQLASPHSDIAKFCFDAIIGIIKNSAAYRLLLALSLFADSANREVLGFVTEFSELERDEGVVELEKLSLVNRHQGRFSLLPLTQLYCQSELAQSAPLKKQYEQKMLDYFVQLVLQRKTLGKYSALELIQPESANIHQVIDRCWEAGLHQPLIKLISGIHFYLWISGEWHSDLRNLELGVQAAQEIEWELAKANMLILLTGTLFLQDEYDKALEYALEAQRIYEIHDDGHALQDDRDRHLANEGILDPSHGICLATWRIGEIYTSLGEYNKAQISYETALKLSEERNDRRNLIRTYQRYAVLDILLGNYDSAEAKLHHARQLREKSIQISSGLSYTYSLLGQVAFRKKDWQKAQSYLEQALQMARDLDSHVDIVGPLSYMAMLKYEKDELDEAILMAKEAREISVRLGLLKNTKLLDELLDQF